MGHRDRPGPRRPWTPWRKKRGAGPPRTLIFCPAPIRVLGSSAIFLTMLAALRPARAYLWALSIIGCKARGIGPRTPDLGTSARLDAWTRTLAVCAASASRSVGRRRAASPSLPSLARPARPHQKCDRGRSESAVFVGVTLGGPAWS